MERYICTTCGLQYPDSPEFPQACIICSDERQYVNWNGQEWTTLADLQQNHRHEMRPQGPHIMGIAPTPRFSLGQRALLVQTSAGNLLWDCIPSIDDAVVAEVQARGGIQAIAISHPHYYASMVEWSERFDAPIYLHAKDREWVVRHSAAIDFWKGQQLPLFGGLTLIHCGGHFAGSIVAHWAEGETGAGALLTGDTMNVVADRRFVSFMRSYPNHVPLSAKAVQQIAAAVEPFAFERIYGAWWDAIVLEDGKAALGRSVERYLRALED